MSIELLDKAIKEVCPIHGISIGRKTDKTTWQIDFNNATQPEKDAAQTIIDNFDINAPAPIPTKEEIYNDVIQNQKVLKALALVCADQFSMTPAQIKAAVKAKM